MYFHTGVDHEGKRVLKAGRCISLKIQKNELPRASRQRLFERVADKSVIHFDIEYSWHEMRLIVYACYNIRCAN